LISPLCDRKTLWSNFDNFLTIKKETNSLPLFFRAVTGREKETSGKIVTCKENIGNKAGNLRAGTDFSLSVYAERK
jgi:hypothetical protein